MPKYTLSRLETLDVVYTVEADSLDQAVRRVENYDYEYFTRDSESGSYFSAEAIQVLLEAPKDARTPEWVFLEDVDDWLDSGWKPF